MLSPPLLLGKRNSWGCQDTHICGKWGKRLRWGELCRVRVKWFICFESGWVKVTSKNSSLTTVATVVRITAPNRSGQWWINCCLLLVTVSKNLAINVNIYNVKFKVTRWKKKTYELLLRLLPYGVAFHEISLWSLLWLSVLNKSNNLSGSALKQLRSNIWFQIRGV